ncbi:MAG: sigma-70 family RNA polymerase sigma factor [Deltaproteobacteria bacterium]|nr:sigma-70 family RNA polymerase sigma factor [Deltaproteobacteria bacterium]
MNKVLHKEKTSGCIHKENHDALSQPVLDITALYKQYSAFIARIIRQFTGEGPHVEDILQATFICAFKKMHTFEGRSSVQTWLYSIAANLCKRHHRSNFRFLQFRKKLVSTIKTIDTISANSDNPARNLQNKEMVQTVFAILDKMPFKLREVFILFEFEQYSGEEIANLVNVPPATIRTRLFHAHKLFKNLFDKEMKRL